MTFTSQVAGLLSFVLLLFASNLSAQHFSGLLKYRVSKIQNYSMKIDFSNGDVTVHEIDLPETEYDHRDTIEVHVHGGNYRLSGINKEQSHVIYEAASKSAYIFKHDSERVEITDVRKSYGTMDPISTPALKPDFIMSDSIRLINGIACNLLILDFGFFGSEEYWYNSEFYPMDHRLLRGHKSEYLYQILKVTKSLPIEFSKFDGCSDIHKVTFSLFSAEEEELPEELFSIPAIEGEVVKSIFYRDNGKKYATLRE